LFNYIEPGHVKIKQNQIHTFDNFTIYDDNQGKYMNLFVVLFKFLPYYWKTVGAERIELSPTAEDYTGWYSLADFNFSSMVYSSDYELYLNNGTQSTEQCRTWVSFETGTAGDNWTWWYVRMPYIREFPNNHSAPWGNVSKIVYDPLVHYYFDLPPWMRPEVPDDQIPLIYGYNLYILINIICLISISYVMIQKRKKFK
jgi:hypothetical protein